ncbi:MAG TPA: TOBE domain-containing protein, partial [Euzebyales bacterium]|nr:TOBE domain-containing protein [Euzebyales bacterium]
RAGVIEQLGKPREIYERPASRFVADFIGTSNFVDGTVRAQHEGSIYLVETAYGELRATSSVDFPAGSSVVVSIRPEHVLIDKGTTAVDTVGKWSGTVETRAFLGESVDHIVHVRGLELRARCNPSISIPAGTEVTLTFPETMCSLIPRS